MTTEAPAAGRLQSAPSRATRLVQRAGRPFRHFRNGVDRLVARVDGDPVAQTVGAVRVRRGIALLVAAYALVYEVKSALHGDFISPVGVIMLMVAVAVYSNRGGRFLRDWTPVVLGIIAYGVTVSAVPSLGLEVHYLPQVDADRVLGLGTLPTNWLQDHLYSGGTGALEVFSVAMYLSHFLLPLVLAFLLWAFWQSRGFSDLLFGLLAVSILADVTFLLAPTAPPWLASEQGLIPHVQPIIQNSLYDLHLDTLAARKGDASSYNVVAAIPSLHVAWPIVCLLVIRKHGLPRWLLGAQAFVLLGVVFAVVYTGEHYVVDALVGAVYGLLAWWLVQVVFGGRSADVPAAVSSRTS